MIGDFDTVLNLVGPLDDTPGENTPRERFRAYLSTGLTELGSVRDAVQTCITHSGSQYARALQDLVNFLGSLIGFEVEYGRYAGVQGQVGHDGLWRSGTHVVVVEAKTTDAFVVDIATLLNYINSLRATQKISPDDRVIGLYVYARRDSKIQQMQQAIIADKRTQELRISSVDAVLSLAELIRQEIITVDEALAILWPSGVWIDDTVSLLQRVAAVGLQPQIGPAPPVVAPVASPGAADDVVVPEAPGVQGYYMAVAADIPEETARETIENLVGKVGVWGFAKNTPHRSRLKPGDKIAFYQSAAGVVATATVKTAPRDNPLPGIMKIPEKYSWTFELKDIQLFFDQPIVIDSAMRAALDAFTGKDPNKAWSWFVFANRALTQHDYHLLTGGRD
jgi:hypothetical protein